MNLQDVGIIKEKIVMRLIHDSNIVDVLLGDTSNIEDMDTALFGSYTTGAGGCVYKYEYVPDTQENAKTFLCVEIVPTKTPGDSMIRNYIYVFCFCSKRIISTYKRKGTVGTRVDILMSDVDKILNGNNEFGIGPLEWKGSEIYKPQVGYYGRVATYEVSSYRRPR